MEYVFNITMTDTAYKGSTRRNVSQSLEYQSSRIPSKTKQVDAIRGPHGKAGVEACKNKPEQDAMSDITPQGKVMPWGPVYGEQDGNTNERIAEVMHRNTLWSIQALKEGHGIP
ncbi:hypothetical protein G6F43_006807 [Rhizopus delemar]|nr:hypothetical protein G6F43_006807 [Rhizopus delemar]